MFISDTTYDYKDVMKKLATLSLAAAVLAMTAGCSMLPQAAPAPTVTVTATADPSSSASKGSPEESASAGIDSTADSNKAPTDTALSKTMWDFQDGKVSDESFVAHVRANTGTLDPYDSGMLVVLAQTTCAAVANGTTKDEIVEKQSSMAQSKQVGELTKEMGRDVAYLLAAGGENYCPEHFDELVGIINS